MGTKKERKNNFSVDKTNKKNIKCSNIHMHEVVNVRRIGRRGQIADYLYKASWVYM